MASPEDESSSYEAVEPPPDEGLFRELAGTPLPPRKPQGEEEDQSPSIVRVASGRYLSRGESRAVRHRSGRLDTVHTREEGFFSGAPAVGL